jgi:hypothetical protein
VRASAGIGSAGRSETVLERCDPNLVDLLREVRVAQMARWGSRTEHAGGTWVAPGNEGGTVLTLGTADLRFASVPAADGSEDVDYVFGEWA